ncbi:MAG: N-acetylmuramoyl-L-alanine amidase [Rhizonema sp. NSF051]|nr:N-acetylmuramoyl-L-alanine amidase [Rhizonema sp. NSF051]
MKFGIDFGHNCPPDTGASGIQLEDDVIKAVGTILTQKLRTAGHEVVNCTPRSATSVTNSLHQRVEKANQENVDLLISIHFNAFNSEAHGSEVYYISEKGKRYAEAVLNKIVALGFRNRGIKYRDNLYVLKHTKMPAILIECCFCDSSDDMRLFDAQKMADALKDGLIAAMPSKFPAITP